MPLNVVCSKSNRGLWNAFTRRVLPVLSHVGPVDHPAQIWLTHRLQRDLLLEAATREGLEGWLNPPIRFFSNLPELFGIAGRSIGLLARRELISAIGYRVGQRFGIQVGNADATITRGNMLDALFGELLPDGVTPQELRRSMDEGRQWLAARSAVDDEFAPRRDQWVSACYEQYVAELAARGLYDARAIHARVAERVEAGALSKALGGAAELHIYGVYSARSRRRLLTALARQENVDVRMYAIAPARELLDFASSVYDADATGERPKPVQVQPAPDANREVQWIARQAKTLILGGIEPHDIAVVARSGREDTRRAMQALRAAGVPATARVRTPLSEISALKALLDLFRAAAQSWTYRPLRAVLAGPYLGARLDLRAFDRIAADARPASLREWQAELERLRSAVESEHDRDARRMGIHTVRLKQVIDRFTAMLPVLEQLDTPRTAADWLLLTRGFLADRRFRQRICKAPLGRYDIVRLDQRGVRQAERILGEWLGLDEPSHEMTSTEWYRSLRTLLESQELVMTTPRQKGVQVLEAHDAALVPFAATFVMHANDGEFPHTPSSSGLFTEEERDAFAAAGLPVAHRAGLLSREHALWQSIVAGDRVAISYRTTDPRGTPLLPSLLVPPHDSATELPRTAAPLDPVVNADQARRAAAIALADAVRGTGQRVAVADPMALRHAVLNAYAETMRGAPDRRMIEQPFNAWNGVIRDPAVLTRLGTRFGSDHAWSASQLEAYAAVPFFFLLDRVLGLRELDEAEDDTSMLTFGSVAHDVLESFYRDVADQVPIDLDDKTAKILDDAAERVFAGRESSNEWLGAPILWRERRERIRQVLTDYLAWELPYLSAKGEAPVLYEYVLGNDSPLVLHGRDVHGSIREMRVTGRIDRIDRDRNGLHHVLDYKSGSIPSASGYTDGSTLQAPLYLEALRASGLAMGRARYRSLRSPGKPQNGAEVRLEDDKFTRALAIAFTIPAHVRSGRFEAVLAACATWRGHHPDLSVRRTNAQLAQGSRYDD